MKRSLAITLAVLFVSFGAPASEPASFPSAGLADNASKDYFATVKAMFDDTKATVPTAEEANGWTNGRCFHHLDHSTPLGGLLIGQEFGGQLGPLFPPKQSGRIFMMVHRSNASGFDLVSKDNETEVKKWVEDNAARVTRAKVRDRALASMYLSVNGTPADWQVRRYVNSDGKNYMVLLATQLLDTSTLKEGDVMYACYFFEKAKLESKP